MENPTATVTKPAAAAETAPETALERTRAERAALRLRHAQALTALMEERADLRGVHALADHFDEAVRWTA